MGVIPLAIDSPEPENGSTSVTKLCLDCPAVASPRSRGGSRCTACERTRNTERNAQPGRQAYSDPAYLAVPLVGPCVDAHRADLGPCAGDLTRDHVIPLARGGTNARANITIRCRRHNSKKRDRGDG